MNNQNPTKMMLKLSPLPPSTTRLNTSLKIPQIRINFKKRHQHLISISEIPNSYLLKLDDPQSPSYRPIHPSPKQSRKRPKKLENPVALTVLPQEPIPNFLLLSPVIEEYQQTRVESTPTSVCASPKNIKASLQSHLNYTTVGKDLDQVEFSEKSNNSGVKFPISFKRKKKQIECNTINPTGYDERFFFPADRNQAQKLEKILKSSSTPTPEMKVPHYIRHESYKASYFLSRIDKVLRKIRVQRSKSSLNSEFLVKNIAKMNAF